MKPRARQVTLGVAALVALLVAALVIVHWDTVRDHVEAWHFQLTRETESIMPEQGWAGLVRHFWLCLQVEQHVEEARTWDLSFRANMSPRLLNERHISLLSNLSARPVVVELAMDPAYGLWFIMSTEGILQALREHGYRVLAQRFPRRAYVVIRADDHPIAEPFVIPGYGVGRRPGTERP